MGVRRWECGNDFADFAVRSEDVGTFSLAAVSLYVRRSAEFPLEPQRGVWVRIKQ